MSAYRARHGPNFSQYLTDLNTLSPQDNQFAAEDNDFSNDLAMYTNTDFTNLDMPSLVEDGDFDFDMSADAQGQDSLKYEELLAAPASTTDFGNFGTTDVTTPTQRQSFYTTYNTPIQPAPATNFSPIDQIPQQALVSDSRRSRAGTVVSIDVVSTDEKSRAAAEEDKRRRNTAASARFRVKKKQREQALERTLKDASDKNAKLEARLSQLEMENKWLKNLITEKNGLQSKDEMAAAYEQHRRESEDRDLKQEPRGIGTS